MCAALSSGGTLGFSGAGLSSSVMFSSPALYVLLRGWDGAVVYQPASAASGAPVRGAGSVDPCHSSRTFCVLVVKTFFR